jgi:hypothetical protein
MLLFLLLLIINGNVFAQSNYVSNGDFETYSQCPTVLGDQIMFATGWKPLDTLTINLNNTSNHDCSAEYCNRCSAFNAYSSIPLSGFYYQYPHSANGMADVFMYYTLDTSGGRYYLRDYIQSKLIMKLSAGKRYCVTFYVNLAEISGYAIKEISAYLDNGAIDATKFCGLPQTQVTPQVTNSGGPITDTAGWTKIEGSFIANGNEQFITIGNF